MNTAGLKALVGGVVRWFDPRGRQVGTWAFIINRVTALGLTLYLVMHLMVLSTLAFGPSAYDGFIALAKSPLVLAGEFLVVLGGLMHGLNGVRVGVTAFGIAVPYQKQLFFGLMALALIGGLAFAVRMFGGAG